MPNSGGHRGAFRGELFFVTTTTTTTATKRCRVCVHWWRWKMVIIPHGQRAAVREVGEEGHVGGWNGWMDIHLFLLHSEGHWSNRYPVRRSASPMTGCPARRSLSWRTGSHWQLGLVPTTIPHADGDVAALSYSPMPPLLRPVLCFMLAQIALFLKMGPRIHDPICGPGEA